VLVLEQVEQVYLEVLLEQVLAVQQQQVQQVVQERLHQQ
jgi:hypothetical protein